MGFYQPSKIRLFSIAGQIGRLAKEKHEKSCNFARQNKDTQDANQ